MTLLPAVIHELNSSGEIGDASGVEVGMLVLGDWVPEGTTVVVQCQNTIPVSAFTANFEVRSTADAASVNNYTATTSRRTRQQLLLVIQSITLEWLLQESEVDGNDSGTELTRSAPVTLAQDTADGLDQTLS